MVLGHAGSERARVFLLDSTQLMVANRPGVFQPKGMKTRWFLWFALLFGAVNAFALEASLQAPLESSDTISDVYRDIIVVQRKAKEKAGKSLFHVFATNDLSDGPQTVYSVTLSYGRAFSDTFEAYLSVAPVFLTQDRPIKQAVSDLTLANGKKASLVSPKPKIQYGVDLLWVPAYGKDGWGPHNIVRSDTFFKFSTAMTQYEGASGLRLAIGMGKTFYLSKNLNPRLTAGWGFRETIVNEKKAMSQMGLFEAGNVWYF